jgi:hypothetical protein
MLMFPFSYMSRVQYYMSVVWLTRYFSTLYQVEMLIVKILINVIMHGKVVKLRKNTTVH